MNRREFLTRAGYVATWATIPVVITGCGDGYGDSATNPPQDRPGDIPGVVGVSAGHGHSVTITAAQVEGGEAVVLTLTGSGHTHTVSLTAEEVGDVGEGTRVSKQSSSDQGHVHQVTFN